MNHQEQVNKTIKRIRELPCSKDLSDITIKHTELAGTIEYEALINRQYRVVVIKTNDYTIKFDVEPEGTFKEIFGDETREACVSSEFELTPAYLFTIYRIADPDALPAIDDPLEGSYRLVMMLIKDVATLNTAIAYTSGLMDLSFGESKKITLQ